MPALVNLPSLIDDARCFELVRQHRWPDGVRCPRCGGAAIARDGRDDVQPHRQRYRCAGCGARFDDLSGTVLAGRHRPLRLWVLCLYLMGLNLSNRQIARELDLAVSDVQAMTEVLRQGLTARRRQSPRGRGGDRRGLRRRRPQGQPGRRRQKGRPGRRRRLRGAPGRGTLDKDKPPILGLLQRGGEVVVRMLADVRQATIRPVIEAKRRRGRPRPHRRVRRLRPAGGLGLRAQDRLPRAGRVRPGRGRRRLLRGPRQHRRGPLVAAALLAAAAPGHLAGEAARLSRLLPGSSTTPGCRGKALLGTLIAGLVA